LALRTAKLAYEDVADQLRRSILSGRLRAGRKLPSEAALGQRYGVSRSTIREALRALSSQGIVRTTRGVRGGSSVRRFGHTDATLVFGNAVAMLSNSEEITIAEILQARQVFEVPIARMAALERTSEHIAQLRAQIPPARTRKDSSDIYKMHVAFHHTILDATGNRLVGTMMRPLFDTFPRLFTREVPATQYWGKVATDHRAILRAIEKRDAETAARLMRAHLRRIRPAGKSSRKRP
jgi:DNA-binding FadR family transcriptional regulator